MSWYCGLTIFIGVMFLIYLMSITVVGVNRTQNQYGVVSEPCLSFVETVRKDRKRFKVGELRTYRYDLRTVRAEVSFEDLLLGRNWVIVKEVIGDFEANDIVRFLGFPAWMTDGEKKYVWDKLQLFYEELYERKSKRSRVLRGREQREINKHLQQERNNYIKEYCKEE